MIMTENQEAADERFRALAPGMFPAFFRYLRGIAGYVVDLYRLAVLRFANPHSYTKFLLIDKIRRKCHARVCIETGTFLGLTTSRCARVFDEVYTIEIDKALAAKARNFLSARPHVHVICGDALEELPRLFGQLQSSGILVFLDGHYCGKDTGSGTMPEPAIQEIEILANHADKIAAIIIDDFRNFGAEEGFPAKWELLRAVETQLGNKYDIQVFLDQLIITRRP